MVDLSTRLDVSNDSNSQFQVHRVKCISRPCDSRNLNLNPLCMLEITPHPKLWTDRVKTITLLTLSLLNISGKRNIREGRTFDPLLHRHLADLHEKEAQGQPSCAKVKGKKSEIGRSFTLSRVSFTMLGRKTLLSSISSLARTPSWVSKKVGVSHNRAKLQKHMELTQFM